MPEIISQTVVTEEYNNPKNPWRNFSFNSNYFKIGIVCVIVVLTLAAVSVDKLTTHTTQNHAQTPQSTVDNTASQDQQSITSTDTSNTQLKKDLQIIQGNVNELQQDTSTANDAVQNDSNDNVQ